jgi:hypothetical protein
MANFSAAITDLDGNQVKDMVAGPDGKPQSKVLTLARISANALMQGYSDEPAADGETKLKRFALGMKVNAGGEVALTDDEKAMLKERINKAYVAPLIVGRAFAIIDAPAAQAAASESQAAA